MGQVQIKGYMKKDGNLMFYINDFKRNVSLGIGEKVSTSKLSKGQKSLLNSFFEALGKTEAVCEYNLSDYEKHKEAKNHLDFGIDLFCTDISTICGNSVGEDGLYIAKDGKIYNAFFLSEQLSDLRKI